MMKCPCCGANLIYKDEVMCCEYCGYEKLITRTEPNYNLLITHSNGLGVIKDVIIEIPDSNVVYTLAINSSVAYKLIPGPHKIIFRVGSRSWTRLIVIPQNNETVKADFSYTYDGEEHGIINIEQPNPGPQYAQLVNGKLPDGPSKLSYLAFVLSVMMVFPGISIMLAIIDIIITRSRGRNVHVRTKIALGISLSVITLTFFAFVIGQCNAAMGR